MGNARVVGDVLQCRGAAHPIGEEEVQRELGRIRDAFDQTRAELRESARRVEEQFNSHLADIFRAHEMMLDSLLDILSPDSLVDGNCYWRVRGGIDGFWSSWSAAQLFRIDTRKPNTTTLLTPAQDSWSGNRRPYFSWSAVTDIGGSGISKYFIQVDNDSLFGDPRFVEDSTNLTNYTPASDLPGDGRFFWRVRARDNAGNYAFYATGNFGIDTSPPSSPISFNATPDGWTSNPNFTLAWTNPDEPSGISLALYKVGSAPGSNFDTTGHFPGIPPATFVAQNTGILMIYLWLVDGVGNTSYLQRSQDSIRFDITPPSDCVASSPDSSNRSISVTWTAGTDVGSGIAGIYDVRYKDGLAGVWTDWLNGTNNLFGTFQGGVHNHTYFFEARCRDLAGNVEPFTGVAETQTIVDTTLAGPSYLPGDANGSGNVNGLDVVYLVAYLKGGPPPPDPILRGDANGSCSVNGLDVTYLVSFLKGGPPRWEPELLEAVCNLLESVAPGCRFGWDNKVAVPIHLPGRKKPWAGLVTKKPFVNRRASFGDSRMVLARSLARGSSVATSSTTSVSSPTRWASETRTTQCP